MRVPRASISTRIASVEPADSPGASRATPGSRGTSVRTNAALSVCASDRPAVARARVLQEVREGLRRAAGEADPVERQDRRLEPRIEDQAERGIGVELLLAGPPPERVVVVRVAREEEAEEPHPVVMPLGPQHVAVVRDERRDPRVVHQHRRLHEAARVGQLHRGQQAKPARRLARRHVPDRLEEGRPLRLGHAEAHRHRLGRARSSPRRRGTRPRARLPGRRPAAAGRRAGRAPPGSRAGTAGGWRSGTGGCPSARGG